MRALADYEATLCPLCGLPRNICQSPEAELRMHSDVSVCWATAHMQEAMRKWLESNGTSPARDALVARVTG